MFRPMEKLIMLLDIYEEEVVGVHSVGEQITEKDEAWIISKQFGFIKWLVENEKIDLNEFMHKSRDWDIFNEKLSAKEDDYLSLLMLLSIQDEPIGFLVSILK